MGYRCCTAEAYQKVHRVLALSLFLFFAMYSGMNSVENTGKITINLFINQIFSNIIFYEVT